MTGWSDLSNPERDVLSAAGDGPMVCELDGRRERLEPALLALVAAGLVTLTARTSWEGEPLPCGTDVLTDDRTWTRSLDAGRYVEVSRTPAGDATLTGG